MILIVADEADQVPAPPERGSTIQVTKKDGTVLGPLSVNDVGRGLEKGQWTTVTTDSSGEQVMLSSVEVESWSLTSPEQVIPPAQSPVDIPAIQSPDGLQGQPERTSKEEYHAILNDLVSQYVDLKDSDDPSVQGQRSHIFELVWNFPFAGTTIGNYLIFKTTKNPDLLDLPDEEREYFCRDFLKKLMDKASSESSFEGYLKDSVKQIEAPTHSRGDYWAKKAYTALEPYMREYYGIDDQGLIADDLWREGTPDVVIWEAFRRNKWNNYKDEQGNERIAKAAEKMTDLIRSEIDKEVESIQDPSQKESRFNELVSKMLPLSGAGSKIWSKFKEASEYLKSKGIPPSWEDKNSPDWLEPVMIGPSRHALGHRQTIRYLREFNRKRSPAAAEAFEMKAPPMTKEAPKNPFDVLSKEINETKQEAEKALSKSKLKSESYAENLDDENLDDKFDEETSFLRKVTRLKERLKVLDPNNPDRMRRVMEFVRDEYEDDDPKYVIATAFMNLPMPQGEGKHLQQMRKQLEENLTRTMSDPVFKRPRKDEMFGLTPPQRFNMYLKEFVQDLRSLIMKRDFWDDLKDVINVAAFALRRMVRIAALFAMGIRRS